jgi:hypothetical protein
MKELKPDLSAAMSSFRTTLYDQRREHYLFAPEYLQDAVTLNPLRGGAECSDFQWRCVPRKTAFHR